LRRGGVFNCSVKPIRPSHHARLLGTIYRHSFGLHTLTVSTLDPLLSKAPLPIARQNDDIVWSPDALTVIHRGEVFWLNRQTDAGTQLTKIDHIE
jgi:hypothetical protein